LFRRAWNVERDISSGTYEDKLIVVRFQYSARGIVSWRIKPGLLSDQYPCLCSCRNETKLDANPRIGRRRAVEGFVFLVSHYPHPHINLTLLSPAQTKSPCGASAEV
jgi:hypothetical protein